MRIQLLLISVFASLLWSCGSSNKSVAYAEDKAYYDALKKLSKKQNDPQLRKDAVDLYHQAVQQHSQRIDVYRNSMEQNKFDMIIAEYNSLQRINESIRTSAVFREVESKNYLNEIQTTKQEAAEMFYQSGLRNLDYGTKQDARKAYDDFRRTKQYVSGYKDVDRMMNVAYEASIINIMINPIQNSFPGMWNTSNWNYDPRFRLMHEQLIRDLGGQSGSNSFRYFSEMDTRRLDIRPDWVIDINWSYMSSPPNVINRYDRQVNKNIEIGKDTLNKPVYQTVKATLHITRYQNPSNDIDYRIVDVQTNQTLDWNRIQTSSNSQVYETATFSGDSRALSSNDWALVNSRGSGNQQDQMIRDMYNDLLQELRSRIQSRY
jgi:hypothetical protein